MQLDGFEQDLKKVDGELARLDALNNLGRQVVDPDNIDVLRQDLQADLAETAKVTAVADRLNLRRRGGGVQDFAKKVNLVKEPHSANPESLAQEVLRLRKIRKELEAKLNLSTHESDSDDF